MARNIFMCIRSGFNRPDVELQENKWCVKSGGFIMLHEFQPLSETSPGLFVALQSISGRCMSKGCSFPKPVDLFFRDGSIVLHKIHGSYSVKFSAHEQEVNCVDFQGGLIVSGSRDRTAKVSRECFSSCRCCCRGHFRGLVLWIFKCQQNCCEPYTPCGRNADYLGSCLWKDACSARLVRKDLAVIYSINCWLKLGSAAADILLLSLYICLHCSGDACQLVWNSPYGSQTHPCFVI